MRKSLLALVLLPIGVACGGVQTVHLSASEPATIWLDGKQICERAPCDFRYERQGCGFPRLMTTNRIGFEARTADGRSGRMFASDYCDVPENWFIVIEPKP